MGDFFSELKEVTGDIRQIGNTAKQVGRTAQDLGKAAGQVTTADDRYRYEDANGTALGDNAQVRAMQARERLRQAQMQRGQNPYGAYDPNPMTPASAPQTHPMAATGNAFNVVRIDTGEGPVRTYTEAAPTQGQATGVNERGSQLLRGEPHYTQALELMASANLYQKAGNNAARDEMIAQARAVVAQIPKDSFNTLAEPAEANGRHISTSVVKVNGREIRYNISEDDNLTPEQLLTNMAQAAARQQRVLSVEGALKATPQPSAAAPTAEPVVAATTEPAGKDPRTAGVAAQPAAPEAPVTAPVPSPTINPAPLPPLEAEPRKMIHNEATGQVEDATLKLKIPDNDTLKPPVVKSELPVIDLKHGGTERVAAVQQTLESLGFSTDKGGASDGKVDGVAGDRTKEAVRKVEEILIKAGKLDGKADGVIDDKFVAALADAKTNPALKAVLEAASGKALLTAHAGRQDEVVGAIIKRPSPLDEPAHGNDYKHDDHLHNLVHKLARQGDETLKATPAREAPQAASPKASPKAAASSLFGTLPLGESVLDQGQSFAPVAQFNAMASALGGFTPPAGITYAEASAPSAPASSPKAPVAQQVGGRV